MNTIHILSKDTNVSRETFWWYNNPRGNKMVKKALKYILLITLAAIIFFYGYSKFEDKKEWTDFVNEISLSEHMMRKDWKTTSTITNTSIL